LNDRLKKNICSKQGLNPGNPMITPWHIEQFLFYEYIIMNRIIARYYVLQFQDIYSIVKYT
jgi:hypothetical protein